MIKWYHNRMIDREESLSMNTIENALPEVFSTFSEARKNGFLKAKEIKDHGGRIAGGFCTFTPNEILDAAGIHSVSLCGMSDETIPAAEAELPKNLCPLIKSSYGFAITDKCPYTYFSDIIIGESTCDGKKKMYELLGRRKPVHMMHLPQGTDRDHARRVWAEELRYLIQVLEKQFGITITEDALRTACNKLNRNREARLRLMNLQRMNPAPAFGRELSRVLDGAGFSFDLEESTRSMEKLADQILEAYNAGTQQVPASAKRILVTGCPTGGVLDKTVGQLEENGGVVVCMENCSGIKAAFQMIDTEAPDIIQAIADRYLEIGCSVMSPNPTRMQLIRDLTSEFAVDGIVEIVLQGCHTYSIERRVVQETAQSLGIPYLSVETDYSQMDSGQLATRLTAFIEML